LPVRSVIAPPQAAQKQMPVSKVGPLTTRGATIDGWRLFKNVWTASNSAFSMIGGTAISTTSVSALRSRVFQWRVLRILALLDTKPPPGFANWTAPLLAKALCDVHEQYIWRFLRAQKIDLSGRKSWCGSNDPDFVTKAAEIVGLYMAPPENAIILAVDEKPSIQALERAQGYLKLPNGRSITGQSHDYKRARHQDPLRGARRRDRQSHRPPYQAPPTGRVPRLHE
jgi:hypothetical protein